MSVDCGAGDGVDCNELLTRLPAYLDGEMDAAEAATFRSHLEACAPCMDEHDLDHTVKALVGRCCGGETASERLRAKVLTSLTAVRSGPGYVEVAHVESERTITEG